MITYKHNHSSQFLNNSIIFPNSLTNPRFFKNSTGYEDIQLDTPMLELRQVVTLPLLSHFDYPQSNVLSPKTFTSRFITLIIPKPTNHVKVNKLEMSENCIDPLEPHLLTDSYNFPKLPITSQVFDYPEITPCPSPGI
jgi:hypothetical protein